MAAPRAWAQTVLPIPSSPQQMARGGAGVALPTADAAGFFLNPAHLGFFGRQATVAVQSYPSAADWLPGFFSEADFEISSTSISGGYDLSGSLGLLLSVGAGYLTTTFDFGEMMVRRVNEPEPLTVDGRERYDAVGLGAGLDYLVDVSVGAALKRVTSRFGALTAGGEVDDGSATMFDVGALVTLPLMDVAAAWRGEPVRLGRGVAPFLDLSAGYALQNVGGELEYSESQALPLPRTARLRYAAQAGADVRYAGGTLRALALEASMDAEDLLASRSARRKYLTGTPAFHARD